MASPSKINGINIDQLFTTIDLLRQQPELALFKFRATNKWLDGTHSRATVKDFYGPGKEDTSRQPRSFDLDEPPVLLGGDDGTNPVEYLLVALSGCITTSLVAYASANKIPLKGVASRFEGDIDLRGFLGISKEVPIGYQEIRVYFKIDADISEEQKQELLQTGIKYSPVANTIKSQTPISVQLNQT
ncbi:MAG: OsmC family protein [Desulfobacteraceae bacterium]